nr:hypothetical protein [Tanacetum cinerariifolium]
LSERGDRIFRLQGKVKKIMELVPVEELYIKALKDLDKLWSLVKETCSTTEVTDEKVKELWVELKRLYEPNSGDPLWALQRKQAKRDSEIARIHAEKELKMMITELDRSNEMVTKYLSEYEQAAEKQSEKPKELSKEELKKIMELVPVEELYIKALKDLDKLWSLVKETCSTTEVTDEKVKELWVELKRLYEPNSGDPLWALQ